MKSKRCYLTVKKLYKSWASKYDKEANLCIDLKERITKPIFSSFKNKKISNLDCGTGCYAIQLSKRNKVTAVNFSNEMLTVAKQKAKKAKTRVNVKNPRAEARGVLGFLSTRDLCLLTHELKQGDCANTNARCFKQSKIENFKSSKYDIIISFLVLDHIKNLKKILANVDAMSKKGTELFITNTPAHLIYQRLKVDKKVKNQFYHPLEEYLKLFRWHNFELIDFKDLIFNQKLKHKRYKEFFEFLNQPIGVYMRFKKK